MLYGLQLDDLRAAIMRTRMVPVTELLARIPLLVRGLSRDTGRVVRLEIEAQDAELDKAVGDRIFPAIVHLIRNAIDHAIEPPDERERVGKPREGVIRIFCNTRASNQLELTLSDDGRGIDAAAVARRAGREVPTTDAALLELLCTPGFSTLDQATTTSGRGLGMDIVKRIVTTDLRGELTLHTTPGQGTTFALRLPLTLTIVDVFLVQCGSEVFVVPVSAVEEIIEVEPARKLRGPIPGAARGACLYERRDEALTLVELGAILRLPRTPSTEMQGLVVRRTSQAFIFEIDRVLGQQEVVVRPIEDPLAQAPGVAGATDLGDGRPILVLDLIGLSCGPAPHRCPPGGETHDRAACGVQSGRGRVRAARLGGAAPGVLRRGDQGSGHVGALSPAWCTRAARWCRWSTCGCASGCPRRSARSTRGSSSSRSASARPGSWSIAPAKCSISKKTLFTIRRSSSTTRPWA